MNTDKYRFTLLVSARLLLLMFLSSGCAQTKLADLTTAQPTPKVERQSYGEPGPRKIAVIISGDVKHPGKYYLDDGANLDSVLSVFGGWGARGDGGAPPTKATLTRMKTGVAEKTSYRFWKMTKEEREAV